MQAGALFNKNTYTQGASFTEDLIIAPLGTLGVSLNIDLGKTYISAGASGSLVYDPGGLIPHFQIFAGIGFSL